MANVFTRNEDERKFVGWSYPKRYTHAWKFPLLQGGKLYLREGFSFMKIYKRYAGSCCCDSSVTPPTIINLISGKWNRQDLFIIFNRTMTSTVLVEFKRATWWCPGGYIIWCLHRVTRWPSLFAFNYFGNRVFIQLYVCLSIKSKNGYNVGGVFYVGVETALTVMTVVLLPCRDIRHNLNGLEDMHLDSLLSGTWELFNECSFLLLGFIDRWW